MPGPASTARSNHRIGCLRDRWFYHPMWRAEPQGSFGSPWEGSQQGCEPKELAPTQASTVAFFSSKERQSVLEIQISTLLYAERTKERNHLRQNEVKPAKSCIQKGGRHSLCSPQMMGRWS